MPRRKKSKRMADRRVAEATIADWLAAGIEPVALVASIGSEWFKLIAREEPELPDRHRYITMSALLRALADECDQKSGCRIHVETRRGNA